MPIEPPVTVSVEKISRSYNTVVSGFYFMDLPIGTHKVTIRKKNYHPVVFHVKVRNLILHF